jgi:hypothetical protein
MKKDEEKNLRISIEEMLTTETIERIGCGPDRDINTCLVRICGEVRDLQDQLAHYEKHGKARPVLTFIRATD